MPRKASSKRSDARKTPASSKRPRDTPAAKKTKGGSRASPPASRKASSVKGKPRTACTRSAKGASKAPKSASEPAETRGAHRQRIEVRNVNVPGYRNTVDAAKYASMRDSLFSVLPASPPGLAQNEMLEAILPKLSQKHFPRGDKAMWWIKTVQLDQESRGAMKRSDTKPLRWWRVG